MNKITLHIISLVLMIVTLQLGLWLSTDITLTILTGIGCMAFGYGWKRITDYLIDKHD